jgi:hypothetical protein
LAKVAIFIPISPEKMDVDPPTMKAREEKAARIQAAAGFMACWEKPRTRKRKSAKHPMKMATRLYTVARKLSAPDVIAVWISMTRSHCSWVTGMISSSGLAPSSSDLARRLRGWRWRKNGEESEREVCVVRSRGRSDEKASGSK